MKKIAFVIAIAIALFSASVQAKVKEKTVANNCQVVTTYSAPKAPGTMKTGWFTEDEAKEEVQHLLNGRTEMEAQKKGTTFSVACITSNKH